MHAESNSLIEVHRLVIGVYGRPVAIMRGYITDWNAMMGCDIHDFIAADFLAKRLDEACMKGQKCGEFCKLEFAHLPIRSSDLEYKRHL